MARGCDTDIMCLLLSFFFFFSFFLQQVIFLTVNHHGPLPLRELHSTGETIGWRDPGGSWSCLTPAYDYQCDHLATVPDTCGICPKQHTKKRGALGNTKKTKLSWDVDRRSVWKRPKRKHSECKEPYEMLNTAKPLSNNNSWTEEGQRKSPKMNQSNQKRTLQKSLWEEQTTTKY